MLSASLVKDINTTFADANPQHLVASNGVLYFQATDGYHGTQLWKTNGTAAGTVPVTSLVPGAPHAIPSNMTDVNGTLYFFAQGPSDGSLYGLWKSDGTPAGTSEVVRVAAPDNLIDANGTLYFTAWNGNIPTPSELFRSDGTAAGTTPVASVPGAAKFSYADGMLYFLEGTTLWKSDGTAAGTIAVGSIENPAGVIAPDAVVAVGRDRVYVIDSGQLWTSDGTAAGTDMIDNAFDVAGLIDYNGTLFFATHGFGDKLWKTDGTDAGTVLVKDIPSATYDDQPGAFAIVNGTLYFNARDTAHGEELWRSDGTTAGTSLVADINPGPADAIVVANNWVGSGDPIASMGREAFGGLNGAVYFAATDGTHGVQLWRSDGAADGTSQVAQINTTNIGSGIGQSVTIGGTTYFSANDGVHGDELWKTDGTAAGTGMVVDLTPGAAGSYPTNFVDDNGTLYFEAFDGTKTSLYKTDGTAAGTALVASQVWADDLTPVGNELFYLTFMGPPQGTGSIVTVSLSAIDATTGKTTVLQTLTPYIPTPGVVTMAQFDGKLFYTGLDANGHLQLWTRDPFGDNNTATLVQTFAGAAPRSEQLLVAGGSLYFVANDGTNGPALWKTDGTTAGTAMAWATGQPNRMPTGLYAAGGDVYFTLTDQPYGASTNDAYKTDGTTAGTIRLSDQADVSNFTAAGGKVYFYASSSPGQPGTLYVTDGTTAGTRAVDPALSIWSGYAGVEPMLAADGLLYFIASDANRGTQIWQTDGTTTTLPDPSNIGETWTPQWLLGRASGGLVFTASDRPHGNELWDLPVAPGAATASFLKSDATTGGDWAGTNGADGYAIVGGGTSVPSYVSMDLLGSQYWQWAAPGQASGMAPLVGDGSSEHVAAADYSGSSFTVDLNFNDGQAHQVAFYLVDYDRLGRSETVTITNADTGQVLDTRSVSNFQNGQYLVYTLSGHMKVTFTNVSGSRNAVLSGVLFDPAAKATAAFAGTDTTTQGTWTGRYGTQGYEVIGGGTGLPAHASVTPSAGTQGYEWASSPGDARQLQVGPGSTSRVAACFYSNSPGFSLDVALTDGNTHQVSLYLLDYDARNRAETVIVSDAVTGAVLDSRTFTDFANGVYARWNLSGDVRFTILNAGGLNEVVSGIFIDPVTRGAATFIAQDATTQGTWTGTYGGDGYAAFGAAASVPSYATLVIPSTVQTYTWAYQTSEARGLQAAPGSSNRIAACDYSDSPSFSLDLHLTDGNVHRVALYFLDYDNRGRAETVTISDATTGAVLDTQNVSNFTQGKYLVWNLSGNVKITITNAGGLNEVLSGIFFG